MIYLSRMLIFYLVWREWTQKEPQIFITWLCACISWWKLREGEMLGWDCYCVCVRMELFFTVHTTGQQFSSIFFVFGIEFFWLHRKKSFSIFPSPAGMSLTKLSLGGNYDVICKLFLPMQGEFGKRHPQMGGKSKSFFYGVWSSHPTQSRLPLGPCGHRVRDGVGVAILTHHTKPSTQTSIISLLLARPSGYTQGGRDPAHCFKYESCNVHNPGRPRPGSLSKIESFNGTCRKKTEHCQIFSFKTKVCVSRLD